MTMETRSALVTRASKDGRTVEMRALAYNVLDDYRTVFAPGFGAEGLKRWQPTIIWSHDAHEPVGITTASRVTSDAVFLTARLSDPNSVPRAKQAAAQLAERVIRHVSIGFSDAVRRRPTPAEEQRWPGVEEVLVDGVILECSLLAMVGAVPGADILSVRGRDRGRGRPSPLAVRSLLDREADEALDRLARRGLLGGAR